MTVFQLEVVEEILNKYHNRVSLDVALTFNQLLFGSLCSDTAMRRHFIDWDPGRECFYITEEAKARYRAIKEWAPYRQNHDAPLGKRVQARRRRPRPYLVKGAAA